MTTSIPVSNGTHLVPSGLSISLTPNPVAISVTPGPNGCVLTVEAMGLTVRVALVDRAANHLASLLGQRTEGFGR